MAREKYTLLHNMFDWLPNIAETGAYSEESGLEASIHISYYGDKVEKPDTLFVRTFTFTWPSYFSYQSMPGPGGDPFERSYHQDGEVFNGLGEVLNSKLAAAWNSHFKRSTSRHFLLPFMDNNFCFIIIARDWAISEPRVLCDNLNNENEIYVRLSKKYSEEKALQLCLMQLKFPESINLS